MTASNSAWLHTRGGTGLRPASSRAPQRSGIVTLAPVAPLVITIEPVRTPTCIAPRDASTNQSVERTAAVPTAVSTSNLARPLTGATTARNNPSPSDRLAPCRWPAASTVYARMVICVPEATEMIEPSAMRSFSSAGAATSRISPTWTARPSLSTVRLPPLTTKQSPLMPITVPADCAIEDWLDSNTRAAIISARPHPGSRASIVMRGIGVPSARREKRPTESVREQVIQRHVQLRPDPGAISGGAGCRHQRFDQKLPALAGIGGARRDQRGRTGTVAAAHRYRKQDFGHRGQPADQRWQVETLHFRQQIRDRVLDGKAGPDQIGARARIGRQVADESGHRERPQIADVEIAQTLAEIEARLRRALRGGDPVRSGPAPFAVDAERQQKFAVVIVDRQIFEAVLEIPDPVERLGADAIDLEPVALGIQVEPVGERLVEKSADACHPAPRSACLAGKRQRPPPGVDLVARRDLRQDPG